MILLDGPMGTELAFRGVQTQLPLWSASALGTHPDVVETIHRLHIEAGADIVTTNTFRTSPTVCGERWEEYTDLAVDLARRAAAGSATRVAGSIAPLADCYRPDLSPALHSPDDALKEHRRLAERLAIECDLLLCETFPSIAEATLAVRAAAATGIETWVALTAGPAEPLLSPHDMQEAAQSLIDEGAAALLISCTPAAECTPYVEALAGRGVPVGVYGNAGLADDDTGFRSDPSMSPRPYLTHAKEWRDAGAEIIGGCCGTRPAHIKSLAQWRARLR